jgi:hypothetical protein
MQSMVHALDDKQTLPANNCNAVTFVGYAFGFYYHGGTSLAQAGVDS